MKQLVFVLSLLALCFGHASAVDIYDGALGTSPVAQGKLTYASSDLAVHFTSTTKTVLDTNSAGTLQAGFANYDVFGSAVSGSFPVLDRTTGFRIRIENLKINSETHSSTDRAGFSLIALGSDKKGIELGFWQDTIFAQKDSPLFTQGESASHAASQAHSYDLFVLGNSYWLALVDGPTLLTGTVRDYGAWPNPAPPFADPYELSNYLFVGDNTQSAAASAEFSAIRVLAVPEPGTVGLLGSMALLALRRRVSVSSARNR